MRRPRSADVGLGVVFGLGTLYVATALLRLLVHRSRGGRLLDVWFDVVVVAGVGAGLLYGSYRMRRAALRPELYPLVGGWCLGGLGVISALLVVFHLNPTTSLTTPSQSVPILTALGSAAGFGAGVHRARAAELRRAKARLDDLVDELEASNERLEQFAYAISHDLKQPLRTMTSYLQLIERRSGDEFDEREREWLEEALGGATRMREMIDGLLEYARIDAEDVAFEPIDCQAVLEDVVADLEVSIEERGAEVRIGSLPTVYGDRNHLRLLFQNLLENAIKYTNDEPPRIRVDAERDGDGWRISVADDGIGIPAEDAERIFELFERSRGRDDYEGTGLGLALCKRIVDHHAGEIRVESELGEGSTFYVTLPSSDRSRGDESPSVVETVSI